MNYTCILPRSIAFCGYVLCISHMAVRIDLTGTKHLNGGKQPCQKSPFLWGIEDQPNTWFPAPTRVHNPISSSTGSPVFAGVMDVSPPPHARTHAHTHTHTPPVYQLFPAGLASCDTDCPQSCTVCGGCRVNVTVGCPSLRLSVA